MSSPTYLYRFRSIDRLLGESRELENQEIYLSSPDQLNDPMEGYQDVFWRGDAILWENLLRHYLLSLLWTMSECVLLDAGSFRDPQIPATLTEHDLPTDVFRELYRRICDRFFVGARLAELSGHLAGLRTPLRMDGMRLVLGLVHASAVSAVTAGLQEQQLLPPGQMEPSVQRDITNSIEELFTVLKAGSGGSQEIDIETLALAGNHVRQGQALELLLQQKVDISSVANRKLDYLLFSFPDRYAKEVSDSLIHPDWYAACFSATCTNASMWSTYGDQHRGVALVFRSEQGQDGHLHIPVSGAVGVSGSRDDPTGRLVTGTFRAGIQKVQYTRTPPEIDFFQYLARLPMPKLLKSWHSNRAGECSPLVAGMFEDEDAWRRQLWDSFSRMATTKLQDWSHEEEYRMVIADNLGIHAKHRTVRYDLSQLAGIVFGLRTTTSDKLRIVELIRQKCQGETRQDFTFYQMTYSGGQLIRV